MESIAKEIEDLMKSSREIVALPRMLIFGVAGNGKSGCAASAYITLKRIVQLNFVAE